MNILKPADHRIPFGDADAIFDGFSKDDVIELAYASGDFMLAIDESGNIVDAAVNAADHSFVYQWVGHKWSDTVAIDSVPKIEQMLGGAHDAALEWRQVNHPHEDGDIPVRYKVIRPANNGFALAIGRDLRTVAMLQQRLLKTQQSMERDYLNLRQTETRYRLLFDNISYPVLIIEADNRLIQQANRACHALMGCAPGSLDKKDVLALVDEADYASLIAYLGAASVNGAAEPVTTRLTERTGTVKISASPFRQSGKQYLLLNIDDGTHDVPSKTSDQYVLDAVEQMPDAFVLTDDKQDIIVANKAFAELVQTGSVEQLLGQSLNRFIGRPEVDLGLLRKQLKDHQNVRNFSSVVNDLSGGSEPVEISAIMIERDHPIYGYSIRSVGRRERDLPQAIGDRPRSVDQLTELVGRKPLKEIVRESTDLIERMCIEAALAHTSDNRASAAEILGLSRQSLYSKLHRHGLGNLTGKDRPN
ncbi:MAG: transcriptional regulator PpsR [Sphingomonadales bacterium]|nr:transcriptional regulator PpsR [Sphingomonadales bacterium]NCO48847.1 transcriptional regulator PpsR [Sphingomonadales bacterium]NCO99394.1 transcriptional regulator PpsR [Sphingomonadales bacterium]NCP27019.1 transcriptional regulator PpsR [Sphingomonadales bacterium]NCP42283.1 transcriptional regulator PpsR [Sphingomonadales bacterium]